MSILVTGHCSIILWICLLPLSVCLTEVMHSRFIWIYYIIVYWQSLCVIEFIWLSVYITGHSRIISSGVVHWIWYWTSKLYIWTITDGSHWSVSSWTSKIYIWKSLESLDEHYHRSLIGIINYYHCSRNKTHIWRIFNSIAWTSCIGWSWLTNITVWMNNVPECFISS